MKVLDATLREGEQRSNQSYSIQQKIDAAKKIDELGVDYIQIGFPIANDGTVETVKKLEGLRAQTTGIARALKSDIDAAAKANVDVIEVSAPTSEIQRSSLLGVNFDELREQIVEMVDYARESGCEVHFGAMDGFRTDAEELNTIVADLDVPFFGIADTVGVRSPDEVTRLLNNLKCDLSKISVHFHNDLGVATANAHAAARAGVGKVDTTIAGVGERVGNTPFEELAVILALRDRNSAFDAGESNLIPLVQEILDILDEEVSPQKPLLGQRAFEHESGMHTAAMLDDPATFEAFPPSQFGGERRLLFGPSSGQGAARRLLERAGVQMSQSNVEKLLESLSQLDEHITIEEAMRLTVDEFEGNKAT